MCLPPRNCWVGTRVLNRKPGRKGGGSGQRDRAAGGLSCPHLGDGEAGGARWLPDQRSDDEFGQDVRSAVVTGIFAYGDQDHQGMNRVKFFFGASPVPGGGKIRLSSLICVSPQQAPRPSRRGVAVLRCSDDAPQSSVSPARSLPLRHSGPHEYPARGSGGAVLHVRISEFGIRRRRVCSQHHVADQVVQHSWSNNLHELYTRLCDLSERGKIYRRFRARFTVWVLRPNACAVFFLARVRLRCIARHRVARWFRCCATASRMNCRS